MSLTWWATEVEVLGRSKRYTLLSSYVDQLIARFPFKEQMPRLRPEVRKGAIFVITAVPSKAQGDVLTESRSYRWMKLKFIDCRVSDPDSVRNAIVTASRRVKARDVVLVTRGGGARIELDYVFENEEVMEALAELSQRCATVLAVGHADDEFLTTKVVSHAASTPTAGVQLIHKHSTSPKKNLFRRSNPAPEATPVKPLPLTTLIDPALQSIVEARGGTTAEFLRSDTLPHVWSYVSVASGVRSHVAFVEASRLPQSPFILFTEGCMAFQRAALVEGWISSDRNHELAERIANLDGHLVAEETWDAYCRTSGLDPRSFPDVVMDSAKSIFEIGALWHEGVAQTEIALRSGNVVRMFLQIKEGCLELPSFVQTSHSERQPTPVVPIAIAEEEMRQIDLKELVHSISKVAIGVSLAAVLAVLVIVATKFVYGS
ncbi:MAG: exodeoxyribonuclease VII large subunit [Myxococcota bacterium]